MKKNIQLKIENKLVDYIDDLSVVLNKTGVDFSDPNKRKNPYSMTIKIPLTKNNKIIFEHIDNPHIVGRFDRTENYSASLFVDDLLVLDGSFILRKITEDGYEGNLVDAGLSLFLDFGDKTLQDLKLPEIPFEGMMIPYQDYDYNNYNSFNIPGLGCLDPSICFDFTSLVIGEKSSINGLLGGKGLDLKDYYKTSLVAYSNFPSSEDFPNKRTLTNNLGLDNFMPQIYFIKVVEQMIKDLGYELQIDDNVLRDSTLLFPYFGSTSPEWNWKHLSKTSVFTDYGQIAAPVSYTPVTNRFARHLLASSNNFTEVSYFANIIPINHNPENYQQFTNTKIVWRPSSLLTYNDFLIQGNSPEPPAPDNRIQFQHMLLNGVQYDFNNNFSVFNPPYYVTSNNGTGGKYGQVYTVPADGEYEFDLEIEHHIRTYTFRPQYQNLPGFLPDLNGSDNNFWIHDLWKRDLTGIAGYDGNNFTNNTWMYNSQEQFFAANAVMFVRDDFDAASLADAYQEEFSLPQVDRSDTKYKTAKKMRNFLNDSVVAYYHPMLRDLYCGGRERKWEDYINDEKSILVNPNPIPTGKDTDELLYMGFQPGVTTILEYDNKIGTNLTANNPFYPGQYNDNYSLTAQYQRKLVRTKKAWNSSAFLSYGPDGVPVGKNFLQDTYDFTGSGVQRNLYSYGSAADGIVKFKFKANLKKGEQIRMVYLTARQFAMCDQGVWSREEYANGGSPGSFVDKVHYNDYYGDEYKVKKYIIRSVDEKHQEMLKLSNFLPKIKQKDFFSDLLKSNNLYYTIENNTVKLSSLSDYLGSEVQSDLTSKMLDGKFEFSPLQVNKSITYGLSIKKDYDFITDVNNPTIELKKSDNIYSEDPIDLTSKLFYSGVNKDYNLRLYPLNWKGGYEVIYGSSFSTFEVSIPSFQEGGDKTTATNESNPTYNRGMYLVKYDSYKTFNYNQYYNYLVEGLPLSGQYIRFGLSKMTGGYLDNINRSSQFDDDIISSDSSMVEAYFNLNELDYIQLDLKKPVRIDGALYYIQKIENFNLTKKGLTKIILLKI